MVILRATAYLHRHLHQTGVILRVGGFLPPPLPDGGDPGGGGFGVLGGGEPRGPEGGGRGLGRGGPRSTVILFLHVLKLMS